MELWIKCKSLLLSLKWKKDLLNNNLRFCNYKMQIANVSMPKYKGYIFYKQKIHQYFNKFNHKESTTILITLKFLNKSNVLSCKIIC